MAALSIDGIPMPALPNNADQINFDNTGTGMLATKVDTAIKELKTKKAETDMVAADFNAGTSYTAGNYCVQDGKLYKFKNNHSGAWSASDVDEVKITGELSALKSGLISVEGKLVTVLVSYSSTDGCFPLAVGTPEPALRAQITTVGRNISNGAVYAVWYDSSVRGFRVGGTISGDAPQNGESIYVQYFA